MSNLDKTYSIPSTYHHSDGKFCCYVDNSDQYYSYVLATISMIEISLEILQALLTSLKI